MLLSISLSQNSVRFGELEGTSIAGLVGSLKRCEVGSVLAFPKTKWVARVRSKLSKMPLGGLWALRVWCISDTLISCLGYKTIF